MHKYIIVVLLALLSEAGFSSSQIKKALPKFIPKGYVLFDTVFGDLNKDGLADCAVIIKKTGKKGIVKNDHGDMVDRNRRGIIVLLNKNGNYELALRNCQCFSSENEDGGLYFPPELSLDIRKGNLYVYYSHGRYGYWYYTFRYQNSDFELIGFDSGDMRGPVIESMTSINYVTKKKIIRTNVNRDYDSYDTEEYKEVFEEKKTTIKDAKLHQLSTIKDIEELGYELID